MPTFAEIKRSYGTSDRLYEDPEFPAVDANIFFSREPPRPFVWKRPTEICEDPKMVVGGTSRFDVEQGRLGNCWFIAAMAALSQDSSLLGRVVPKNQTFGRDYCGAFRFFFWRFDEWEEVVIDDRLPTYNNRLVFSHSDVDNEFWSALLEKAYAKLHGSYEALRGGQAVEGLEDFTGGLGERFELKDAPEDLFTIMQHAQQCRSLMCCSVNAASSQDVSTTKNNGLTTAHAYTITSVSKISVHRRDGKEKKVELVRIRNPTGGREWNGPWSDKSPEWGSVLGDAKRRAGVTFDNDGEFWMDFGDFTREFSQVDMCHLSPDLTGFGSGPANDRTWETTVNKGKWTKGISAGGCRNFPGTFHTNPQFAVTLEETDDDDSDDCTLLIELMQADTRKLKELGKHTLTIGFAIYQFTDDKVTVLPRDFFLYNASKARSSTFINTRSVTGRFKLPKGTYCVVPSTYNPNEEGRFILRMFTIAKSSAVELDDETGVVEVAGSQPEAVRSDQDREMDSKFYRSFLSLSGTDEVVDIWELQGILSASFKEELQGQPFSLEAARSLAAYFAPDNPGKISFGHFKELWMQLRKWRKIFATFDHDKSGDFTSYELREALKNAGYTLSNAILYGMAQRFGNKKNTMGFNGFIHAVVRLKRLSESEPMKKVKRGARVSYDEIMEVASCL